jgi:hypothetical protein
MLGLDATILAVPDQPTGACLTPEEVIRHEAAHAVMAQLFAGGVDEKGIDLDHRSQLGAKGGAVCLFLDDDPELEMDERTNRLFRNVMVACAGPASDAKLTGKSLEQSLRDQWSDHRNVVNLLRTSLVIERDADSDGQDEMVVVIDGGLEHAANELAKPEVWLLVEAVSEAISKAGGTLTGPEIVAVMKLAEEGISRDSRRS